MPLVSVIIPGYNHANYLKGRINSILHQTFQDLELIILDDCSTDNSREVIEEYRGHPQVSHIVLNDQNSGSLFKQWKKGIDLAQGKYIWIAESDDSAQPEFLQTLLPILEADENIMLAYADSNIIDAKGQFTGKKLSDGRNVGYDLWTKSYIKDGKQQFWETLYNWCSVNNASSVLFRADQLRSLDIVLQDFFYGGDWATYINLAFRGKIAYVHEPFSNYREHAQNASKSSFASGKIYIDHFRIFLFCVRHLSKQERKKYFSKKAFVVSEGFQHTSFGKFISVSFTQFKMSPGIYLKALGSVLSTKIIGRSSKNKQSSLA